MKPSYFPIKIYLIELGYEMLCLTPEDVPNGELFQVIENNVKV